MANLERDSEISLVLEFAYDNAAYSSSEILVEINRESEITLKLELDSPVETVNG